MKKQLSEKDKKTLNALLQVNLLSRHSEKNIKQKPNSLKFLNTGNFSNYISYKELTYRNLPNTTTSTFYPNTERGSKTSRKRLVFKPKRLVKLYGGEIPLKLIGKSTFDFTKTFYKMEEDEFEKKINSAGKKNKIFSPIEKELKNINPETEIKTTYGVKFAQIINNFCKFKKNIELVSKNRKRIYEELFNQILKLLDIQSHIFFKEDIEDKSNLYKTSSTFNTILSQKANIINYKTISEDKNNNIISNKIKKIISLCLEIDSTFYKFINLILNDLNEKNNDNLKLSKKSKEHEIRNNQISKELDELKKYNSRYDVMSKIYLKQGKENNIKKIKENYNKKENEYILNIYKLEDEIRNLTILLNKNKEYYNKLKETEKEVEKNKKENEEIRFYFNKQLNEKIAQNANEKDREEELNNKINDLEDNIDKLKEEIEGNKRKEIETNAKVKKVRMIIDEKNENILMLNEELEWFRREYDKEKFNHKNTQIALQILENRIYKDDGKINEKNEKEEIEENKDIKENKLNNKKSKIRKDKNLSKKFIKRKEEKAFKLNLSSDSNT